MELNRLDFLNEIKWLHGGLALDFSFHEKPSVEVVKERPHRLVLEGEIFFLKAYKAGKAELLFGRDIAKKEYDISRLLFARNRAPEPIGLGVSGQWRIFVSKKIFGESLKDFLIGDWPRLSLSKRKAYLQKFSELLRDMAIIGIIQPDFHLNNIFLDKTLDDFVLIDLQRADFLNRPLSNIEACEQLRYVLPSFMDYLSKRERLCAVSFIARWLPDLKKRQSRFFIQELAYKDIRKHSLRKFPRIFKRKATKEKYGRITVLKARGISNGLVEEVAKNILERGLEATEHASHQTIKDSRHTFCLKLGTEEGPFFIKCYRSSGSLKSLSYLFRAPRSIRSWNAAWYMDYVGIKTILPLFLIQTKNPWRKVYGLIVYPWLDEIKKSKGRVMSFCMEKRSFDSFLDHTAFFIWDMHQKGIFHGDCKITNFLVSEEGMKLATFDLDAAKLMKDVPERLRIKDLSIMGRSLGKLTGSHKDALEMLLKAYCKYHLVWQDRYAEILSKVIKKA